MKRLKLWSCGLTAGLLLAGCPVQVDDGLSGAGPQDYSPEEGAAGAGAIAVTEAALNGEVTFDDFSCLGYAWTPKIREAVAEAYDNVWRRSFTDCVENAFISWSYVSPNHILYRMRQSMPTHVRCADTEGVAESPLNVSNETLTIDLEYLRDASVAEIASTVLQAVARNKGFDHPGPSNDAANLKHYAAMEYAHTVGAQLARCSLQVSAGASTPRPHGRRRDELSPETTLAAYGGMGGTPFERRCGIATGLRVRAGEHVNAVGLSCASFFGAAETPLAGGGGGTYHDLKCTGAELLVGIWGYSDNVLGAIGAMCQSAGDVVEGRRGIGDVRYSDLLGVQWGYPFTGLCPVGQMVTGIRGRSGSLVDRLEVECAAIAGFASPSETLLATAGGGGGSPKLDKCAGHSALVGLSYHTTSSRVARLGGMCSEVAKTCSGSTCTESIGSARHYLQAHGGGGGTVGQQACASGSALVGLRLRAGGQIDAIGGVCANVQQWAGSGSAPTTNLTQVGGTGGTATTATCPRGSFLTGWHLRTGSLVDAVRPICRDF